MCTYIPAVGAVVCSCCSKARVTMCSLMTPSVHAEPFSLSFSPQAVACHALMITITYIYDVWYTVARLICAANIDAHCMPPFNNLTANCSCAVFHAATACGTVVGFYGAANMAEGLMEISRLGIQQIAGNLTAEPNSIYIKQPKPTLQTLRTILYDQYEVRGSSL